MEKRAAFNGDKRHDPANNAAYHRITYNREAPRVSEAPEGLIGQVALGDVIIETGERYYLIPGPAPARGYYIDPI